MIASLPPLLSRIIIASHRRCRFVSFWGRDRLRAQFRMVELLEQQQHVMERIVADEWTAHASDGPAVASSSSSTTTTATTASTALSVTDTSMFSGDVAAKMMSSSSGRRSPFSIKRMMHFTSGRAAGRDEKE